MADIKNKMPMHKRHFFTNLEKYLDEPLYYFGSIQRYDYSPDNSDIDAILFTNNADSSISALQNWFQISKNEFKRIVNFLPTSKRIVHGHKLTYKNEKQNISTDILIYNKKDAELVKKDCLSKIDVPFYITTLLVILKTLYYKIGVMPKSVYYYLKRMIMDIVDDGVNFTRNIYKSADHHLNAAGSDVAQQLLVDFINGL
jgi:hypothetical protein